MPSFSCFVTGTDTGVGKTLIARALLKWAGDRGLRTAALKPVAAGAYQLAGQWVNEDGLLLQGMSNSSQSYRQVNPYVLEAAIAPHIAAQQQGRELCVEELVKRCRLVLDRDDVDFIVVEGAGGWLVPLNDTETLADLVVALQLPVVLVVGLKLGCLNHALLTCQAVEALGLELVGWIGSCVDPAMSALAENVDTLTQRIPAPCLGVVDYLAEPSPEQAVAGLRLDVLSSQLTAQTDSNAGPHD
jgi:dethiobiotin synthetase